MNAMISIVHFENKFHDCYFLTLTELIFYCTDIMEVLSLDGE